MDAADDRQSYVRQQVSMQLGLQETGLPASNKTGRAEWPIPRLLQVMLIATRYGDTNWIMTFPVKCELSHTPPPPGGGGYKVKHYLIK